MADNNLCIIMSGIPASGKSSTGIAISNCLGIPYLDKDDFLEELFAQKGTGDENWRNQLSRQSDELFMQQVILVNKVILISHWRPPGFQTRSGTPTDWLTKHFSTIVEIHCNVTPEKAAYRFTNRIRHDGHLDNSRSIEDTIKWLKSDESFFPLNIGTLIAVDSSREDSVQTLIPQLIRFL